MELLLDRGASLDTRDLWTHTPYWAAVCKKQDLSGTSLRFRRCALCSRTAGSHHLGGVLSFVLRRSRSGSEAAQRGADLVLASAQSRSSSNATRSCKSRTPKRRCGRLHARYAPPLPYAAPTNCPVLA
eukprot:3509645-Rhodomonas_salina.2